jgi:hypothetical protein
VGISSFVVLDLHGSDSKALIPDGIKKSNTKKTCSPFFRHLMESADTRVQGSRMGTCVMGRKIIKKRDCSLLWFINTVTYFYAAS